MGMRGDHALDFPWGSLHPGRPVVTHSSSVPLAWALTRWLLELLGVWLSQGQGDSFSYPYLEWVLPGTTEREEGCSIPTGPPPRSPDCATLGWDCDNLTL